MHRVPFRIVDYQAVQDRFRTAHHVGLCSERRSCLCVRDHVQRLHGVSELDRIGVPWRHGCEAYEGVFRESGKYQ